MHETAMKGNRFDMTTTDTDAPEVVMPDGTDLGLARGTDFFELDTLLDERELTLRDRVRAWGDTDVVPTINDYWEKGEIPWDLVEGYGRLQIAGGSLEGYGCPGLSYVAEGMIVAELARADGTKTW